MPFEIAVWKDQATERLHNMGGWLKRRADQDLPYLVYGGLCGMALWPLVEATQSGELLPVMMALGTVASGVGGNLIAEQVQRWTDQADEGQIVDWVVEQAPENPDLRQALDDILERLDAVKEAQATLTAEQQSWFATTLRHELARLGNLERFEAELHGSGAIAQSGGKAVGAGGALVEGDVHGDVVTGTKSTVFDQRGQQVDRQINIAGDWKRSDFPNGEDD
jgi:hypothetical protein